MEFVPALLMFVLFAIDVPIAMAIAVAALSFFILSLIHISEPTRH